MANGLATTVGAFVIGTVSLAGLTAQTQEHVRLVPQLGMEQVNAVAFSPDGRFALTGSDDETARLWEVATGREIRSFAGHTNPVLAVVYSADGRSILTAGNENTARLWDVATGRQIQSFVGQVDDSVTRIALSHDGHLVVTARLSDNAAHLWDVATGKQIRSFTVSNDPGFKGAILALAFTPNGRSVVVGAGQLARMWDVATGKLVRTYEGHGVDVLSVAISADGRFLLTGGENGQTQLWDAASGQEIRSYKGDVPVRSVAFSPDGRTVTAAGGGSASAWDTTTGQQIHSLNWHARDTAIPATFSPDGKYLLTAGGTSASLWDVATGQQIRSFGGQTDKVESVAFSPDGRKLLTGGDTTGRLWDTATGQMTLIFRGHTDSIQAVAFSPDGRSVLTGSRDGTARLWDSFTGQEIGSFKEERNDSGTKEVVNSVAFSPDGHSVVTGGGDHVQLWDAATGQAIRTYGGTYGGSDAMSVAISPNGRSVLFGTGQPAALLWGATSGRQIRSFEGHSGGVTSVAFSPDGRFALTGAASLAGPIGVGNIARLWNATTGQQLRSFKGHLDFIWSVAFSPDGCSVLTGSADHTARLWNATTGKQLRSLDGHSNWVYSAVFSPDGRFVLTGSTDTTTRLWDPATGKELATLISAGNGDWFVTDPEGRFDTNDLDGGAPLNWVVDNDPMRPLPLEIFMRDYYTPRLLSRIMNGEKLPPIRSIAEITNRVQPDIAVVSVTTSNTHPGRADVVIHAASHVGEMRDAKDDVLKDSRGSVRTQASGLQDLRLFRNGQLVGYLEGEQKDGDFTFPDIQLPTLTNTVTFTAYAFNSMNIKSTTGKKDYIYKPGPPAKPRAYLLQIGVNHYQASGCELHGSSTDAEKLSEILTEKLTARGLIVKPARLISTDTENGATKENIRKALAAIAAVATPDDVFFLSFSGHGYGDKNGQFYILPSDVQGSCQGVDDALLKSAISADELTEWLRPIDAGEMTFILDSCDSASSVESNDFKPGPMGSRGLGQLAYDKRMRILAASQSNQAARESDSLHQGLLSYALTQEGLVEGKSEWRPVDKKITVGEWLNYAANEVPKFREAGAVETGKGLEVIGVPSSKLSPTQVPTVFDFSRNDTFVLQQNDSINGR